MKSTSALSASAPAKENDLSVYAAEDPIWLHSLYGENCWQWAIGYATPMIIVRKYTPFSSPSNTFPQDFREACYINIMPGNSYKTLKHMKDMSTQEVSDAVRTGCKEAQMVVLDS